MYSSVADTGLVVMMFASRYGTPAFLMQMLMCTAGLNARGTALLCVLQKFLGSSWPEELGDGWRDLSLEFQEATHNVALKILRALAIALGRDEHCFDEVCCNFTFRQSFAVHSLS